MDGGATTYSPPGLGMRAMLFKESKRHKSGGRRRQHYLPPPLQRTGTGWLKPNWLLALDGVGSTRHIRASGEREELGTIAQVPTGRGPGRRR